MSYILNALKHSESQRSRGEIPHIDSQPEFVKLTPSRWSEQLWKWLALSALVGLLLSLAWMHFQRDSDKEPEPVSVHASAEPASLTSVVQPPVDNQSPAPGLPALAEMSGVRVSLEEALPGDAAATAAPLPESSRLVLEMPVSQGVVPSPVPSASRAAETPTPAPVFHEPAASEELSGVRHWKTLPADVQKELRELAFTAHIYSSNPASRFIRVSGRTLHEGDQLTDGLKLRQITRDGIVLSQEGEEFWFGFN